MLKQITKLFININLLLICHYAYADIDVIDLKHRFVEDIKPLIEPHAKEKATISGQNSVLVIKTDDEKLLAELKKLVEIFDIPLKQFVIELKKGHDAVENKHYAKMYYQTQSSDKRQTQTLRLLEGRKGKISLGKSRAILAPIFHQHAGTIGQWQQIEASSFFEVVPRYTKNGVILQLSQQIEYWQSNRQIDKAKSVLEVSVNVELGQWKAIGSVRTRSHEESKRIISSGNTKLNNEQWSIRLFDRGIVCQKIKMI